MSNLQVLQGPRLVGQFQAEQADRTEWFREVGATLERRGLRVKVGERSIGSAAEATSLYEEFRRTPGALLRSLGLTSMTTRELELYVSDLAESLEDVLSVTSHLRNDAPQAAPLARATTSAERAQRI